MNSVRGRWRAARLSGSLPGLARRLGISPNTVKTHVARVFGKLEVPNRVQAIERARWLAIIP